MKTLFLPLTIHPSFIVATPFVGTPPLCVESQLSPAIFSSWLPVFLITSSRITCRIRLKFWCLLKRNTKVQLIDGEELLQVTNSCKTVEMYPKLMCSLILNYVQLWPLGLVWVVVLNMILLLLFITLPSVTACWIPVVRLFHGSQNSPSPLSGPVWSSLQGASCCPGAEPHSWSSWTCA